MIFLRLVRHPNATFYWAVRDSEIDRFRNALNDDCQIMFAWQRAHDEGVLGEEFCVAISDLVYNRALEYAQDGQRLCTRCLTPTRDNHIECVRAERVERALVRNDRAW